MEHIRPQFLRTGTQTVTFTVSGSESEPDETVLCSADVRARFAVGEWIKIGTQVRQVTAVSAYELTVASPGFTVSSSTGYKFFHRAAEIELALEAFRGCVDECHRDTCRSYGQWGKV